MKPNQNLIDMWTRAAHAYHEALPGSPAEGYLAERGLLDAADEFLLGYVQTPAPGHDDRFTGMLSIPYMTGSGCVATKFRRITDGEGPKYNAPTGQKHHLYNVKALIDAVDEVLIVEGELDAIAATINGHPATAVPGVNAFKPHFARCFDGINRVIVACDNDLKDDGSNPGQELARRLTEAIPNSVRVSLPLGEDVNSMILRNGAQALTDLVGAVR